MRVSNGMRPVHPGEILAEELGELGLSANALANALAVPTNRITAILKGQRGVTADTALRLSRYFGTTPQLWLNLQKTFELRVAEIESGKTIADRVQPREYSAGRWARRKPHRPGARAAPAEVSYKVARGRGGRTVGRPQIRHRRQGRRDGLLSGS